MKTLNIIFVSLVTTCLFSTIINVPADQPSIQEGINAAVDTDTVLVQSGTYYEHINYNGKLITVASLFITTQDTTYISQTVINSTELSESIIVFESGENATAVLIGFTVQYGYTDLGGGGIYCISSSPRLENLIIKNNFAFFGGGIYCENDSSPYLVNVIISDNNAASGGGIYCINSTPSLFNVIIKSNSVSMFGGGMFFSNSNPNFDNVIVFDNLAEYGGGISCSISTYNFENINIINNLADHGGGLYCSNSNLILENVTIVNNSAQLSGGGIYCEEYSSLSFSNENRCNIYSNTYLANRGVGSDIFSNNCPNIDIVVDTFTVIAPTDYYVSPIDNFSIDILHSIEDSLINTDLYVSVDGDNSNSGTSPGDPFKTIHHALSRIYSDSLTINTIHLAPGVYSDSTNGESFPIKWSSYVNLFGSEDGNSFLNAESTSGVMEFYNVDNVLIEAVTILGGSAFIGGGIYCSHSNPDFKNLKIIYNSASSRGGGIYFLNSSPSLENVNIVSNSAEYTGGGIYCVEYSNPILVNVTISDNSTDHYGGGMYCRESSPSLHNVVMIGNSSGWDAGGIYCVDHSNPALVNVTIISNSAYMNGGGLYCSANSSPCLINCIVSDNLGNYGIYVHYGYPTIIYSNFFNNENGNFYNCDQNMGVNITTNANGDSCDVYDNIQLDPLFVGTGDHPFMLLDLSPCVNAGILDTTGLNLPEFDMAGNPRIFGGRIDMGAYENQNVVVGANEDLIPVITKFYQNYPNPFNPTTTIIYSLKENSKVSLNIYNIKGQIVKQLIKEELSAGKHTVVWNGKDDNYKSVSSGIYFHKLKTNNYEKVKKMIMIK